MNNRPHAAKRLTRPEQLVGKIANIARKQDNYQTFKGLKEKDK